MARSARPARKGRRTTKRRPAPRRPAPARFVGRDPSPVLERYPPRVPDLPPPPPVVIDAAGKGRPSSASPTAPSAAPPSGNPLITLDRGFDLDQFSSMLGETSIRVSVPREDLPEVVRRVLEFMGFGVYVYSISLRPGPSDLLKEFVVELRRVDFSSEKGDWTPFVEKDPPTGASSS